VLLSDLSSQSVGAQESTGGAVFVKPIPYQGLGSSSPSLQLYGRLERDIDQLVGGVIQVLCTTSVAILEHAVNKPASSSP
jgi:hypothetical protein